MPEDEDYSVCAENEDGVHGPIVQNLDTDIPAGYASVECQACGTTTGIPIPDHIEWN